MVRPLPRTPCLYEVRISHSRRAPVASSFRHGSFMWLVDAASPPRLPPPLRWLAEFRAEDHMDVLSLLEERGIRPARMLMLTNPRVLGYVFNPLSVYWCYGADGSLLARVVEVHNTYGDRHGYVLTGDGSRTDAQPEVKKEMYVSPFYPVDGAYTMRITEPGPTLSVSVRLQREGDEPFDAVMTGRRRAGGAANAVRYCLRYPLGPLRVRALIQWHGLRLWSKGLKVQPR